MELFYRTPYATSEDELYNYALKGHALKALRLLEEGVNPNARNRAGLFPLYVAAEGGHLRIVIDLIEYGADVNQTTPNNSTALNNAAEEGHLDVVKYLLARGADPTIKTVLGHGPEDGARANGHYEIAEIIANSTTPNVAKTTPHFDPLLQPIVDGANLPSDFFANASDVKNSIFEAFYDTTLSGASEFRSKLLTIHQKANHSAVSRDSLLKQFREDQSFDYFLIDIVKNYCLAGGICTHNLKQIEVALAAGACPDFNPRCRYMNTIITPIVQAAIEDSLEIVKLLIEAGANPNRTQVNGSSALAVSACNGNKRIVQYLLNSGANPNAISRYGSPLSSIFSAEIARMLLEGGSDPNIPDKDGDLPIIAAIDQNNAEMARLFIEFGTNLHHKNHRGTTAVDHANTLKNQASQIVLENA